MEVLNRSVKVSDVIGATVGLVAWYFILVAKAVTL